MLLLVYHLSLVGIGQFHVHEHVQQDDVEQLVVVHGVGLVVHVEVDGRECMESVVTR